MRPKLVLIFCLLLTSYEAQAQEAPSRIRFDTCKHTTAESQEIFVAVVKYDVNEAGAMSNIELKQSSGNVAADRMALEILASCQTLPNLKPAVGIEESLRLRNGVLFKPSLPAVYNLQRCAPTEDDYPQRARSRYEQGVTKVRITFDESGALTATEVAHKDAILWSFLHL